MNLLRRRVSETLRVQSFQCGQSVGIIQLADRQSEVKASTLYGYKVIARNITGPVLEGTPGST